MLSCGFTFASPRAARTPANTGNPTLIYRKTPLEDPSVDRGFYAVIGWGDGMFMAMLHNSFYRVNLDSGGITYRIHVEKMQLHNLDVQVNTNLDILQFLLTSVDNLVKYHQIVKKTQPLIDVCLVLNQSTQHWIRGWWNTDFWDMKKNIWGINLDLNYIISQNVFSLIYITLSYTKEMCTVLSC